MGGGRDSVRTHQLRAPRIGRRMGTPPWLAVRHQRGWRVHRGVNNPGVVTADRDGGVVVRGRDYCWMSDTPAWGLRHKARCPDILANSVAGSTVANGGHAKVYAVHHGEGLVGGVAIGSPSVDLGCPVGSCIHSACSCGMSIRKPRVAGTGLSVVRITRPDMW